MTRSLPSSAHPVDSWPVFGSTMLLAHAQGRGVGRRHRHNPHSRADDRLPGQGMRGFTAGIR